MRKTLPRVVAALTLLSLGVGPALAGGAGRSRPGGSGSGSPQHAVGRASYGHGGHSGHGHHGGSHGHAAYGYSHYGYSHYPPYLAYGAWPWGWWYGGWPGYAPPYRIDPKAPGAIEVDVSPRRAAIHVDGEFVGQPRDYNGRLNLLWLDPGDHVIEFRQDGYKTLRRHVDVRPGMRTRIAERMEQGEGLDSRSTERRAEAPGFVSPAEAPRGSLRRGLLRLEIGPPDAAVYLDGEFLASASELSRLHGSLPVARGPHTIEVVRPGFESHTVDIDVEGEMPVRVEIELRRGE